MTWRQNGHSILRIGLSFGTTTAVYHATTSGLGRLRHLGLPTQVSDKGENQQ